MQGPVFPSEVMRGPGGCLLRIWAKLKSFKARFLDLGLGAGGCGWRAARRKVTGACHQLESRAWRAADGARCVNGPGSVSFPEPLCLGNGVFSPSTGKAQRVCGSLA